VGNYGEIYENNIVPIGIAPRPGTLNALWTDGGLIYAPPWR
jgi:general L-amino acid transport system substrate-binding protein